MPSRCSAHRAIEAIARPHSPTAGDGPEAAAGSDVEVHYVGVAWSTRQQFDASWDRGETFRFGLGQGQVIKGGETLVFVVDLLGVG